MPIPPTSIMLPEWLEALNASYQQRDAELQAQFNRSLPFQDALFDRWERARTLGFGKGTSIYNSAVVMGKVTVGQQTWIGPNTLLDGTGGGLSVGSHCSISAGVHIYTHNTVQRCLTLGHAAIHQAPVSIGDGVYIGAQSIVREGVTIGNRVVIGANSFVNQDIPDNTIVAGSPAKVIGHVIIHPDGSFECRYTKALAE